MKKASKILFLVGAILTIVASIAFIIIGSVGYAAAELAKTPDAPEWVVKLVNEIMADSKCTAAQAIDSLHTVGVLFIIQFVLCIPATVLSFICAGRQRRPLPLLIVATVFAGAAWSAVSFVGGVLGIISWAVWERKEA